MKYTMFFLQFLILNTFVFSQTKEKELSQAERFSSQSGTLIEKQFISLGSVKGVHAKVLKMKNLISGESKSSLRFEYEYKTQYSSDTKIASIDSDELDGLITSIKTLQTSVFNSIKETYTEVSYKSRTGFEAGAFFDSKTRLWKTYIQIDKYDKNSIVFLSVSDFEILLILLEDAKNYL